MGGVRTSDEENVPPQDSTEGCSLVNIMKVNGSIIQCSMGADTTVMDLIKAVERDKGGVVVHEAHRSAVEPVLITEDGVTMERHLMVSDYDIGADSMVMIVMKRNIKGSYCCWMELDTRNPIRIDIVKVALEITEDSVSINDVEGRICEDGEQFLVTLTKPVHITSQVPGSRAFFHATGCQFTFNLTRDYSQSWWYPIEGKFIGASSQQAGHAGRFKARFSPGV